MWIYLTDLHSLNKDIIISSSIWEVILTKRKVNYMYIKGKCVTEQCLVTDKIIIYKYTGVHCVICVHIKIHVVVTLEIILKTSGLSLGSTMYLFIKPDFTGLYAQYNTGQTTHLFLKYHLHIRHQRRPKTTVFLLYL